MEKLNNNSYGGGTNGKEPFSCKTFLYAVNFHCLRVPYLQIYLLSKIYL